MMFANETAKLKRIRADRNGLAVSEAVASVLFSVLQNSLRFED